MFFFAVAVAAFAVALLLQIVLHNTHTHWNFGPSIVGMFHFPILFVVCRCALFTRLFIQYNVFFFQLPHHLISRSTVATSFVRFLALHLTLSASASLSPLFSILYCWKLLNYFCSKDYIWLLYFSPAKQHTIKDSFLIDMAQCRFIYTPYSSTFVTRWPQQIQFCTLKIQFSKCDEMMKRREEKIKFD